MQGEHAMKKSMLKICAAMALALILFMPGTVMAYTTFTFDIGVPNTDLSVFTGPYLQVTVNETSPTTANFDVKSLTNGGNLYLFGDTDAFAVNFNLGTGGSVSITDGVHPAPSVNATGWDIAPTFVQVDTGNNVSDFGVMNTSLKFFDGYTRALKELTFTATLTGGTWSDSNNVLVNNGPNGTGYFAAAHIFPQSVATGAGLATGFAGNGNVPIPPSVLLFGSGLVGLGILSRSRKAKA